MEQLVRCKVCGFITTEDKLGKVCPACGVPSSAFEKYTENISPRRKFILELNLHPIALHFPQAISVLIAMAIPAAVLLPSGLRDDTLSTAWILSLIFPASVLPALCAGILDGKVRFKKLYTPFLVRKIILGTILLFLSVSVAFIAARHGRAAVSGPWIPTLCGACVVFEVMLARIGKTLITARLPG